MSRLDLIIFGATGFTGKHAVKELTNLAKKYPGLKWGIAGRSTNKLQKILQEVSKILNEDTTSVKIIIANVNDEESLKKMCSKCNVLVNCCGPYQQFGEPVVKAAIDSKAHYVDVSGEPQFMESMQLKYNEAARAAGVFVISACGFDSIPVDLGVIFMQQKFDGTLNSVETYMNVISPVTTKHGSSVNYGTWASLVYGLTHLGDLRSLRKKLYTNSFPALHPKLKSRCLWHRRDDTWCLPFPGADAAVAYRTQRHIYETEHRRPAQVKTYVKFPSLLSSLSVVFSTVLVYIMSKTSFTRRILLDYPNLFTWGYITKEDPSEEVTNNTTFILDLYGEGWTAGTDVNAEPPNKRISARVAGVNPGYGMTVMGLLMSAITLLKEKDKMPKTGGVLTPGAAFWNTSIVQRLDENNVKFQLVQN